MAAIRAPRAIAFLPVLLQGVNCLRKLVLSLGQGVCTASVTSDTLVYSHQIVLTWDEVLVSHQLLDKIQRKPMIGLAFSERTGLAWQ